VAETYCVFEIQITNNCVVIGGLYIYIYIYIDINNFWHLTIAAKNLLF